MLDELSGVSWILLYICSLYNIVWKEIDDLIKFWLCYFYRHDARIWALIVISIVFMYIILQASLYTVELFTVTAMTTVWSWINDSISHAFLLIMCFLRRFTIKTKLTIDNFYDFHIQTAASSFYCRWIKYI